MQIIKEYLETGSVFSKGTGCISQILVKDEPFKKQFSQTASTVAENEYCPEIYFRTHVSIKGLLMTITSDEQRQNQQPVKHQNSRKREPVRCQNTQIAEILEEYLQRRSFFSKNAGCRSLIWVKIKPIHVFLELWTISADKLVVKQFIIGHTYLWKASCQRLLPVIKSNVFTT